MNKNDKIAAKLEEIASKVVLAHEELSVMREILAINTEQLRLHIEGVEQTRKLIALKEQEIGARLAPIEDHIKLVNTLTKLLGWSVALPGSIYYLMQIARMLK